MNKELIVFSLIFLLIGSFLGFAAGYGFGVKWAVETAIKVLEKRGYNIDLTAQEIVSIIKQYKLTFGKFVEANYTDFEKTARSENL